MAKKDWETAFACLTDDSQKQLLMGPLMATAFAAGQDAKKKESLNALMKTHGLDPKAKGKDALNNVKNKGALFGDLLGWLEENLPEGKGKGITEMSEKISQAQFSNFNIDGDTATADVANQDGQKKDTVHFRKIDGQWYVEFRGPGASKSNRPTPKFPKNGPKFPTPGKSKKKLPEKFPQ